MAMARPGGRNPGGGVDAEDVTAAAAASHSANSRLACAVATLLLGIPLAAPTAHQQEMRSREHGINKMGDPSVVMH